MSNTSWAYKEATELAKRTADKELITFECGFGPSGLPSIATFAEVARTQMVRDAFIEITGKETRLIVFSDDMDALRKVPTNIPQVDKDGNPMDDYIGMTLSSVPNPFDTDHESFAAHNNAKLQEFLDAYGFDYIFMSSTECYHNGLFNDTIKLLADNIQLVKDIITHDYGQKGGNRKETYCPFIPVHPETNTQLFELTDWRIEDGRLTWRYIDAIEGAPRDGSSIYDGHIKCQWKADWAMRWVALGVDYEMYGKDLIGSAQVGQRICKALSVPAPHTFMYELFVDEKNEKISKSKGNGLQFEEWLRYAPVDSLRWYLFQNPRKSRQLHLGMVSTTVDSYIRELGNESNPSNGVYAVHGANPPDAPPVSFTMLLNLVGITNSKDPEVIWDYITNYEHLANADDYPLLDEMVSGAINYYEDHIEPNKVYRTPSERDKEIMSVLANEIEIAYHNANDDMVGKELVEYLMTYIYAVGKEFFGDDKTAMREDYFKMLYQVLMGQDSGPRFGQFAVIYGVHNTIELLRKVAS